MILDDFNSRILYNIYDIGRKNSRGNAGNLTSPTSIFVCFFLA